MNTFKRGDRVRIINGGLTGTIVGEAQVARVYGGHDSERLVMLLDTGAWIHERKAFINVLVVHAGNLTAAFDTKS